MSEKQTDDTYNDIFNKEFDLDSVRIKIRVSFVRKDASARYSQEVRRESYHMQWNLLHILYAFNGEGSTFVD